MSHSARMPPEISEMRIAGDIESSKVYKMKQTGTSADGNFRS